MTLGSMEKLKKNCGQHMFKNLLLYVKYPSVAGIIAAIWLGTLILLFIDRNLPILQMVVLDMLTSVLIGWIGFRVDKK